MFNIRLDDPSFLIELIPGLAVALLLWVLRTIIKNLSRLNFINVFFKSHIHYIYKEQTAINTKMYADAKNSNIIFIFSVRGTVFTEITSIFYDLLKTHNADIKFLLLNPDSQHVQKRDKELNNPPTNHNIQTAINTLDNIQKTNANIKYALHDEFFRIKFYIFDDTLYLGFRLKEKTSTKSQFYRIGKESILYKAIIQWFYDLWEKYYTPPYSND